MSDQVLLLTAPALLLFLALVAPALGRWLGPSAGWPLALGLGAAGAPLAGLLPRALDGPVTVEAAWVPALGATWSLRFDALTAVFALLVVIVGAVVLAYSVGYLGPEQSPARYYGLLTAFAASMLLLVLAGDGLSLYVGWEGTTLTSFGLIASAEGGWRPARRAVLLTFGGGLALLAALLLGAAELDTTALPALADPTGWSPGARRAALLLLAVAAATKSAQLPFHSWLPGAMVAPTPVSAYLHAAAMVTAGLYLLLRFAALLATDPAVAAGVTLLGVTTAVFGAVAATRHEDLKELLAYSTISHLGFMIALVGVGTPAAVAGAVVYLLAHAAYKSALFLSAGVYDHDLGTRRLPELAGQGRRLPVTAAAVALATVSMAGLPPALGFVGKEEAFAGILEGPGGGRFVVLVGAGLALTLSVVYAARVAIVVLGGREGWGRVRPQAMEVWPTALAVAGVVAGLFSARLGPLVDGAVEASIGATPVGELGLWHGLTPEASTSMAVLAAGVGLAVLGHRRGWGGDVDGDTITPAVDALGRGVAGLGRRLLWPLTAVRTAIHLAVVLVTVSVVVILTLLLTPGDPAGTLADSAPRWVASALVAAGALAVARARDRLTTMATLAAVGFPVAAWYLLHGAAQLAAVQLVVDGLTVALVVFVLRRLPREHPPVARGRRRVALAVAPLVGGAFAALSLHARAPELPPAGRAYLDHARMSEASNALSAVLTEFRAVDTVLETTVLALAALGVVAVLRRQERDDVDVREAMGETVIAHVAALVITPLAALVALWLLLRGHGELGGGFLAAAVLGLAAVFRRVTVGAPALDVLVEEGAPTLVGAGLLGLVAYGAAGPVWAHGPLEATTLHLPSPIGGSIALSSALLFEVAVAVTVLSIVVAVVQELGGRQR